MIEQIINAIKDDIKDLLGCDKCKVKYIPYNGLYLQFGVNSECNWESDPFRFKVHVTGIPDGTLKNNANVTIHYVESAVRLVNHNYGFIYKDLKVGNKQRKCTLIKMQENIVARAVKIYEVMEANSAEIFVGTLEDKEVNDPNKLELNSQKLW